MEKGYNFRKRLPTDVADDPVLRIRRVPYKQKKRKLTPGAEQFNAPGRDPSQEVIRMPKPSVVVPVISGKTVAQAAKQIGTVTRQEMFELVSSAFNQPDASAMCVREANDREFLSEFFLSEMLGAGSANGEAHKICAPYMCTKKTGSCKCKKQSVTLSVKLIPIGAAAWASFETSSTTPHAQKLIQYQSGDATEKYELWVELTALTLANQLVIQNVCPNLPLMFRWFICKQCMYQNEKLLKRRADKAYIPQEVEEVFFNPEPEPEEPLTWADWLNPFHAAKKVPEQKITIDDVQKLLNDPKLAQESKQELLNPCAIVVNELANGGDLRKWLKGKKLSFLELRSMMFQIVAGFYALEKYFHMRHYDAHLGNVLVHELPHKDGVFKYRIDGNDYYVPHYGRLFVLWDFGWARIADNNGDTVMGAFTPDDYAPKAGNPTEDITQVASLIKHWDKSYGIGASDDKEEDSSKMAISPVEYTMIFDENDTVNGVANKGVLSKLELSFDEGGYASYADIFPGEFQPYFSKKANKKVVDSSWDMDKRLAPFDDADLERLSLRSMSQV